MKITETDIQMRFADIDMLGHVNNVNLQHYFDVGKADYYRKVLGLTMDAHRIGLIIVSTSNSYISQTHYTDHVYVETRMEKIGTKSVTLFQRLVSRDTGELRAESRTVMVAFDFEHQVSIPVLDEWRMAIGEV
jgi:acyl-CoA thioester hydrolase